MLNERNRNTYLIPSTFVSLSPSEGDEVKVVEYAGEFTKQVLIRTETVRSGYFQKREKGKQNLLRKKFTLRQKVRSNDPSGTFQQQNFMSVITCIFRVCHCI